MTQRAVMFFAHTWSKTKTGKESHELYSSHVICNTSSDKWQMYWFAISCDVSRDCSAIWLSLIRNDNNCIILELDLQRQVEENWCSELKYPSFFMLLPNVQQRRGVSARFKYMQLKANDQLFTSICRYRQLTDEDVNRFVEVILSYLRLCIMHGASIRVTKASRSSMLRNWCPRSTVKRPR